MESLVDPGPIEFFRKVTGLEPTEAQKELLKTLIDLETKNIAICAGRQTGKTLTCAVAAMYLSIYKSDIRILLTSAQDNWLYDHIRTIWNKNPEFRNHVRSEGVFSIVPLKGYETNEGAKVHVRQSTEKSLRGVGADIAFLDECAEMTNDTITTAQGNLSGTINKLILISTPHKTGMFTDIITDPEKYHFKLFQWSELGCSWHTKEEIDNKKEMMTPQKFKTDVLGEPLSIEERAYFAHKNLDKCIYEVGLEREGVGEKSVLEIGIDWGYEAPTVLVITERIGSVKRKVIFIKEWKGKTIEQMSPEILEIIRSFKPSKVYGDSKPSQYKEWFNVHAKNKILFMDCALGHKDQMLGQLQRKVREHSLIIPVQFINLIAEMRRYRKGSVRGDDYVDALALSCYEPTEPLDRGYHGKVAFSGDY